MKLPLFLLPLLRNAAIAAIAAIAPLALASGALGCSSSSSANKPPVIDDLQGPATASIGATGNYELALTVSCHDEDGMISQASIEIPGFASSVIKTPAQSTFTGVKLALQVDGKAAKGLLTYTLVVVDDQGAKASKSATVTLQ
jgi:hypothetical protein